MSISMLALELFTWWYGQGWLRLARHLRQRTSKVSHLFSVPILLRTLFAPWRRIVTYPGASLDARLRAAGDNLVSRLVGFSVRSLVLLTAGIMLGLSAVLAVVELLIWPLIPGLVVVALVKGIIG